MVILGLGSNEGDRARHLREAMARLAALLRGMRLSRIYESKAVLPPGAPPEWDMPYLNMAVAGETDLTPQELLAEIKTLERGQGRIERGVWGPREIDIDILAMDDRVLDGADLAIPHRQLLNRDFALLPLCDVAPDWRWPLKGPYFGCNAQQIAQDKGFALGEHLRDTGIVL